jgi:hypothetical protein
LAVSPRSRRSRRAGTAFAILFLLLPSYATLAYVVLPAVWRRHAPPPPQEEFPRLTYTAEGIPADPINVALVGSESDLLSAMRAAGWTRADRISLRSGLRDAESVLFDRPYSSAPMSTHFVGRRRPQDVAFERAVGKSPRRRHHVRFWQFEGGPQSGETLWLGAASFDRGMGISHFTGEVMHHIDPKIDAERDALVRDLAAVGRIGHLSWRADFSPATRGRNGGGDRYETDRRLAAARLLGNQAENLAGRLARREVRAFPPER